MPRAEAAGSLEVSTAATRRGGFTRQPRLEAIARLGMDRLRVALPPILHCGSARSRDLKMGERYLVSTELPRRNFPQASGNVRACRWGCGLCPTLQTSEFRLLTEGGAGCAD